jgi:hypothetical protein
MRLRVPETNAAQPEMITVLSAAAFAGLYQRNGCGSRSQIERGNAVGASMETETRRFRAKWMPVRVKKARQN